MQQENFKKFDIALIGEEYSCKKESYLILYKDYFKYKIDYCLIPKDGSDTESVRQVSYCDRLSVVDISVVFCESLEWKLVITSSVDLCNTIAFENSAEALKIANEIRKWRWPE